jgi:hypothetical protein
MNCATDTIMARLITALSTELGAGFVDTILPEPATPPDDRLAPYSITLDSTHAGKNLLCGLVRNITFVIDPAFPIGEEVKISRTGRNSICFDFGADATINTKGGIVSATWINRAGGSVVVRRLPDDGGNPVYSIEGDTGTCFGEILKQFQVPLSAGLGAQTSTVMYKSAWGGMSNAGGYNSGDLLSVWMTGTTAAHLTIIDCSVRGQYTELASAAPTTTGQIYGVCFSEDGYYMITAESTTPFFEIFEWDGAAFVKLTDGTAGSLASSDTAAISYAPVPVPFGTMTSGSYGNRNAICMYSANSIKNYTISTEQATYFNKATTGCNGANVIAISRAGVRGEGLDSGWLIHSYTNGTTYRVYLRTCASTGITPEADAAYLGLTTAVLGLTWVDDTHFALASATVANCGIYDISSGTPAKDATYGFAPTAALADVECKNGVLIAVYQSADKIEIYDTTTKPVSLINTITLDSAYGTLYGASLSPQGDRLAVIHAALNGSILTIFELK